MKEHAFVKIAGGAGDDFEVTWCKDCGLVRVQDADGTEHFWVGMKKLSISPNGKWVYGDSIQPVCEG